MTVAFDFRGQLVGTIRAVPIGYGLTLTENLMKTIAREGLDRCDQGWEMGRLVLAPSFRGEIDVLRHCLYQALSHLNNQAEVGQLFAACTPVLARLYRRFGFGVLERDVALAGTTKTYSLIAGPFSTVLQALSASCDTLTQDSPPAGRNEMTHTQLPHSGANA